MDTWKKYVLWFAQEHVDFRLPELQSLLKLWDIPHKFPPKIEIEIIKPFLHIELPGDEFAIRLASRAVAIKYVLEEWSSCTSLEAFHKDLKCFLANNSDNSNVQECFDRSKSFRITVESYNKHFLQKEKVDRIESLDYIPVEGDVNLKDPDIEWYYIEFYGMHPIYVPEQPEHIIFGKWITDGNRSLINELSLKTRKFIGNTSMDPTLSLLMSNQALVKNGDLVFDPFVGSGSLLVAAAKCGGIKLIISNVKDSLYQCMLFGSILAYVLGTDIDFLMLHGKRKPTRVTQKVRERDESILANLTQYNCADSYLDVLVSDFSNSIWHTNIQFDSIITDPPYGIREATEKIKTKYRRPIKQEWHETPPHYPSKSQYSLSNLYVDLLRFAGKHLRIGGRLICWLPVYTSDYSEKNLPRTNFMKLIANSEQILSSLTSRRLLTYEKIAEPSENCVDVIEHIDDFRAKFFATVEETRQERKLREAELKEIGRQEALKRGKIIVKNVKQHKIEKN